VLCEKLYDLKKLNTVIMKKNKDYCVYDGKEFLVTSRIAKNHKGLTMIELKPKICEKYGLGDEYNIWVFPNDAFMIVESNEVAEKDE